MTPTWALLFDFPFWRNTFYTPCSVICLNKFFLIACKFISCLSWIGDNVRILSFWLGNSIIFFIIAIEWHPLEHYFLTFPFGGRLIQSVFWLTSTMPSSVQDLTYWFKLKMGYRKFYIHYLTLKRKFVLYIIRNWIKFNLFSKFVSSFLC